MSFEKREWVMGAGLLLLIVISWPENNSTPDEQSTSAERELPDSLRHSSRVIQRNFSNIALTAESLPAEELWSELNSSWNQLSNDPYDPGIPRLVTLLRELGRRHGAQALIMIEQLEVHDEQIRTGQFSQAYLSVIGGWSTHDPIAAGLTILTQGDTSPLADPAASDAQFPHKTLAIDRASRDIFKRWAEEDLEGIRTKFHEITENPTSWHPEFRTLLSESIPGKPYQITITESRIEEPVFTTSNVESGTFIVFGPEPTTTDLEGFINYGTPVINIADLPGRKAPDLEEWGGKNPVIAREMISEDSNLMTAQQWSVLIGIARNDPDYLGLLQMVPEENRVSAMTQLITLASFQVEEAVWPIDGEKNSWALTTKDRQAAIFEAIEQEDFKQEDRDKFNEILLDL